MTKIAIVDDEAALRAELCDAVRAVCRPCDIHEFASGEALLLFGEVFDVCLLDIKLKGQTGMETARALRRRGDNCALVFVTSYPDFVYDAFDVEAVHYLVKPVQQERLAQVLAKILERQQGQKTQTLLVKQGQSYRRVPLGDILLVEAAGHKLRLHLTGGESFAYYARMDEVMRQLDGRFFRCHRAFIVNLDRVVEKADGMAVLEGGPAAPVARKRMKDFTAALLRRLTGGTQ